MLLYVWIRLVFLVLIYLWGQADTYADDSSADHDLRFQHLLTNGIGSQDETIGAIKDITQDKQGFLWFAGEFGLARYDSHQFKYYYYDAGNPRSLSANYVATLAVDQGGVLWIGTPTGLNRYDAATDSFQHYTEASGLSSNEILALAVDADNRLLIGTTRGLNILNRRRSEFAQYSAEAPDPNRRSGSVRSIGIDSSGKAWLGVTGAGLKVFDPATGCIEPYIRTGNGTELLLSGDVERVFEDYLGRVWIGSATSGLTRINRDQTVQWFRHSSKNARTIGGNAIRDIYEDHEKNLWIATDHGGLAKYQQQTEDFINFYHSSKNPASLRSNQLRAIFEDADGNLWIGGVPDGVNFYDVHKARFIQHLAHSDTSLPVDDIICLLSDSTGTVWVGSEGGLAAYTGDGKTTRYASNPDDPNALRFNAVTSMAEDGHGDIWVGTWSGGLHRFDRGTQKFKNYFPSNHPEGLPNPYVSQIARDRDNNIWVGFSERGGFARYKPETDSFERFNHVDGDQNTLTHDFVKALIADSRGNLWIGTLNGLDKFEIKGKRFTHYRNAPGDSNSISSNQILALFEDSKGNIWIGTRSDGVNKLDVNTGRITVLTKKDGLPSNAVTTISEDSQGNIWLGTINGVASYEPEKNKIRIFRKKDGLAGSSVNHNASIRDHRGHMWIGSSEGVTEFDPVKVLTLEENKQPRLVFTGLRIGNILQVPGAEDSLLKNDINYTKHLTISYHESMYSIEFASINFDSSAQNTFRYKLNGFDKAWIPTQGFGSATYTNMPAGKYSFVIQAISAESQDIVAEEKITLTITPAPWKTWWAYSLYVALCIALLYVHRHIGILKSKTAAYKILSGTDALTGAYNRNGLNEIVTEIFIANGRKRALCVMMLDIDYFKRINDTYGHDAGDKIIQHFAKVVSGAVRGSDYLARWGGEEFVLLCPATPLDGAAMLAEKIRVAICSHPFELETLSISFTVSIGVSQYEGTADSFERMLKRADSALYRAKAGGRNCVVIDNAA